jgi:hypothetical protein
MPSPSSQTHPHLISLFGELHRYNSGFWPKGLKRQPVFDSSNLTQSKNSDIEKPQIFVYSIAFVFHDRAAAMAFP